VAAYSIDTFAPSAVAVDTSITPVLSAVAINVTGVVCVVVIASTNNQVTAIMKDALCTVVAYVSTTSVMLLLLLMP
jgi:hypothetical protein